VRWACYIPSQAHSHGDTSLSTANGHPRVLFAVRSLVAVFAFVLVFAGIRAGVTQGRSMQLQDWTRWQAEEAAAAETPAKHDESMSNAEIAAEHAMLVEVLDGLLHPYEEFNGKTAYPIFTEDYFRDVEGSKRWWRRARDWHAMMAEKYRRVALSPWDPVSPDPPLP
jgi:hypothetical protein